MSEVPGSIITLVEADINVEMKLIKPGATVRLSQDLERRVIDLSSDSSSENYRRDFTVVSNIMAVTTIPQGTELEYVGNKGDRTYIKITEDDDNLPTLQGRYFTISHLTFKKIFGSTS